MVEMYKVDAVDIFKYIKQRQHCRLLRNQQPYKHLNSNVATANMYSSAGLLAACLLSSIHAKPLPSPSNVVDKRADPPAPSAYPLGDACGNEWQYLNFNPDDDTDKGRLQKLHDVICIGELRALSSWGAKAASDAKTSINEAYDLYFATENPDSRDVVNDVLMMIAGQSSTEGMIGEIVGTMIVDNLGKLK